MAKSACSAIFFAAYWPLPMYVNFRSPPLDKILGAPLQKSLGIGTHLGDSFMYSDIIGCNNKPSEACVSSVKPATFPAGTPVVYQL